MVKKRSLEIERRGMRITAERQINGRYVIKFERQCSETSQWTSADWFWDEEMELVAYLASSIGTVLKE